VVMTEERPVRVHLIHPILVHVEHFDVTILFLFVSCDSVVPGMIQVYTSPSNVLLAPSESVVSNVTVRIADNVAPGSYGLSVRSHCIFRSCIHHY
jgi:hypothetical protein